MNEDGCQHEVLGFGSGDYYVVCRKCQAMWMRKGRNMPEYGTDALGIQIGADPSEANKGFKFSDSLERRAPRFTEEERDDLWAAQDAAETMKGWTGNEANADRYAKAAATIRKMLESAPEPPAP